MDTAYSCETHKNIYTGHQIIKDSNMAGMNFGFHIGGEFAE
jgi:hypothetical protein